MQFQVSKGKDGRYHWAIFRYMPDDVDDIESLRSHHETLAVSPVRGYESAQAARDVVFSLAAQTAFTDVSVEYA